MVTSLVSPPGNDTEKEPAVDAPRPRRDPKPTKKKLEELETAQQSEEPKRKSARKEPGKEKSQNFKEPKQKQIEKEPDVSQKKKSATKKGKETDSNDTQDAKLITAANNQRVQNLLERRQHASWRSEEVEIVEVTAVNNTNQPSSSVPPNPNPQPFDVARSAAPAMATRIISKPKPQLSDVIPQSQSADASQHRNIPNLVNQLSADKQPNGGGTDSLFPPQQLSTQSPSSSHYRSASPVTPASRFQFSTPTVASIDSASRSPSLSLSSLSSPRQLLNSHEVLLSSPVIPQQEFSISQSLSHCSDYVSDLDGSVGYSSGNSNLQHLHTVQSRVSRDDSWQGMPSFSGVGSSCPNCQPLLQSLNNRLINLEAEVDKLKRKQRKVWRLKKLLSVKNILISYLKKWLVPVT